MTTPLGDGIATVTAAESGIQGLSRRRIALILIESVVRTVIGLLLIAWMMTLIPDDVDGRLVVPVLLALFIIVGYAWFFKRQIHSVNKARYPMVRAAEALVLVAAMFLALFAIAYVIVSQDSPSAFTEPLDPFTAYYFALTVLATVGFGDITPVGTAARAITMVQMSLDIVFVAVVIRVIGGAAKRAVNRRDDRSAQERA